MKQLYGGRSVDNDIVIAAPTVSARHFCITLYDTGEMAIHDLESTNGTFVNEKRISNTPTVLQEKDIVRLGDVILDWKKYRIQSQVNTISEKEIQVDAKQSIVSPKKYSIIKKILLYTAVVFLMLILIWYFTQVTHPAI